MTSWIPKHEFKEILGGGSVSLTVYHCLVEFRQNDNCLDFSKPELIQGEIFVGGMHFPLLNA